MSLLLAASAGLSVIALDVFTDWTAHLSDFLSRPFRKETNQ